MASIISTLGAGTGIDTRQLIDQLVAAERTARTAPLTTKATSLDARISALGQVRSALQGIASSLDARVKTGVLGLQTSSSDSAAVGIERRGTGPAAGFASTIVVNRLAAAQQVTAAPLAGADASVGRGTLTIAFGTRTDLGGGDFSFSSGAASPIDIVIDDSNNSLTGLRDAINRSASGITATIVSNADSATLSLKGSDGAAQAFIISAAGEADLARFAYTPGNRALNLASAAADADLSLDGIAVRRSSNVIDDLVGGSRITLRKADVAPVRLSASRSSSEIDSTLSDFASTLTAMRSFIGDFRKGAGDGDTAGALVNDPTARVIDQRIAGLINASFSTANGLRLRDLGFSVARDGSVAYDQARFAALPASRLGDAEALLTALAAPSLSTQPNRLQSIAALTNTATTGLTRQRSAVTGDLAKIDIRLATYRTTLTLQYAAMDRLVAASKAVGAQLDNQIAAWNRRDSSDCAGRPDMQPPHLFNQRRALQAEQLGTGGNRPTRNTERRGDIGIFKFIEDGLQIDAAFGKNWNRRPGRQRARRRGRPQQPCQPVGIDDFPGEMRLGTIDKVLQFADVAGPGLLHQAIDGNRIETYRRAARLDGKMLEQQRNILRPVRQRRHFDAHDIKPIEQVRPEVPAVDGGEQIDTRRRHQPDIDSNRQHAADTFDHPGFQGAEQLGLHRQRHVADFIKEQRAAMRRLEATWP